jgi:hypothetical protein
MLTKAKVLKSIESLPNEFYISKDKIFGTSFDNFFLLS